MSKLSNGMQFLVRIVYLLIVLVLIALISIPWNLAILMPVQLYQNKSQDNLNDNIITGFDKMHSCWFYIFINTFVQSKLHHTFSNYNCDDNNINSTYCNIDYMDQLLIHTNNMLSNQLSSSHNLISLRRIIMLLNMDNIEITKSKIYYNTILLISNLIDNNTKINNNRIIFNIHPPRSAGTTICGYFRRAYSKQKHELDTYIYEKPLLVRMNPLKNCNAGDADGCQFTHYLRNATAITCDKQYNLVKNDYTMIARESPLYNNNNSNISHPYLCDQFIYMLAMRSPIERILSWLKADTFTQIRNMSNNKKWTRVKPIHFVRNFYYSLFENTLNKPSDSNTNIIQIKDGMNNISQVRIVGRNKWLRGYSSNGITKWIGYEWKNGKRVKYPNDIVESMYVSTIDSNKNDIHFGNAIKLLLEIDYVLNFAAYDNDTSVIKALKYSNKRFDDNIVHKFSEIGGHNSMWIILSEELKKHFNSTRNIFSWSQRKSKHKNTIQSYDLLTENDWKTLYQQNYFDFRLYFLSKWIEKVDLIFYQVFT
eukprot:273322_1